MKKHWVLSYPLSPLQRLWSRLRMPRLIWVFAGRTVILLVLSCRRSGINDLILGCFEYEPQHDKTNKMGVRPARTQISLGIRPVWSESLLSAWRKLGSLATHWADGKDSVQTGWMSRLIWVFAGRTLILLVLSCRGSYSKYCLWIC